MSKIISQSTLDNHIYMMIQMNDGSIAEIDVFLTLDGRTKYYTSADLSGRPEDRKKIIDAFHILY